MAIPQKALNRVSMSTVRELDEEYRSTRAALLSAGVKMTDSIDALYREWRRRRDKSESWSVVDNVAVANADQWWALHLAQFRSMIDPTHVAARTQRARKDRNVVRTRPHPA